MNLSAYVNCDCYVKGKTSEPPNREYVRVSDQGLYLDVTGELLESDKGEKMLDDFIKWKRTACEHSDMKIMEKEVCSSAEMSEFKSIFKTPFLDHNYPTLFKNLPQHSQGKIPANEVEDVMEELISLEEHLNKVKRVTLREKKSSDVIASVNSNTYFHFGFTGYNTHSYGIDRFGFFIVENIKEDNGAIVMKEKFRSLDLSQNEISPTLYVFTDLESGKTFECSMKINPVLFKTEPEPTYFEFKVESSEKTVYELFEPLIVNLDYLLDAAIKTKNSVMWE
jgi:hypothetical protein